MIHYKPVAVSSRDGHGHAFSVEVGGGELRHNVRVLAPDGAIVGEVTTDGDVYWDPPIPRFGRLAPMSVRRALATNGRFTAAVDERGLVLCLRAEPPRRTATSYSAPDDERVEVFTRPARIIAVDGRQKGERW